MMKQKEDDKPLGAGLGLEDSGKASGGKETLK